MATRKKKIYTQKVMKRESKWITGKMSIKTKDGSKGGCEGQEENLRCTENG